MTEIFSREIDKARAGNPESIGLLLESYRSYLRLLARIEIGRRLQGKVDASDIVQEVFLDAHRQFTHFRGESESELVGWIREILAGRMANLIRRFFGTQARDIRLEQDLIHGLSQSAQSLSKIVAHGQISPSECAMQSEQEIAVVEAIGRLADDYRTVIILRHTEGLSFPMIAERMNRTVASVEKLWLRALGRLRAEVGGET